MIEREEYAVARLNIILALAKTNLSNSEEIALLAEMAAERAKRSMRPKTFSV